MPQAKKRAGLLGAVALVLVASALFVFPAFGQAQWNIISATATGLGPPTVSFSGFEASGGWSFTNDDRNSANIAFGVQNPGNTQITHIKVRFTSPDSSTLYNNCDHGQFGWATYVQQAPTGSFAWLYTETAEGWDADFNVFPGADFTAINLKLANCERFATHNYTWEFEIVEVDHVELNPPTPSPTPTATATGTPAPPWRLTIPTRFEDRDYTKDQTSYILNAPWDTSLSNNPYYVQRDANIFYNAVAGTGVYAIDAGEVLSVEAIPDGECGPSLIAGTCAVIDLFPPPDGLRLRYLGSAGAYVVTIEHDANLYQAAGWRSHYVVQRPNVEVGDQLNAGCLVGYTLTFIDHDGFTDGPTGGYTVVQATVGETDTTFDLTPYMFWTPSARDCSSRETSCALVADPAFTEHDARWEEWTPGSRWPGVGVELAGRLVQQIILNPAVQYKIRVGYTPLVPGWEAIRVSLGGNTSHTIFDPAQPINLPATLDIPPQLYTPNRDDVGIFYLVLDGPTNSDGDAEPQVRVDFICVSEESDTPAAVCLMTNPEFDHPSAGWTLGGDPLADIDQGVLRMEEGSEASQSIRLGPTDWKLYVRARRFGQPVDGENFVINWSWTSAFQSHSGAMAVDASTFTEIDNEFTVTSLETGTLAFDVIDNSAGSDVVHIDSVCLRTANGEPPPGWGRPPPITATCKRCVYIPVGDLATDLSELVQWLSCALVSIYECQFKSVLVAMLAVLTNVLTFLGFLRYWMHLTITGGISWSLAAMTVWANWFNGQFTNLGITFQNALTSTISVTRVEGSNANLWDVLVALFNNLGLAISSLYGAIQAAVGPVVTLLQTIIDRLFGLATGLLSLVAEILSLIVSIIPAMFSILFGGAIDIIGALFGAFQEASGPSGVAAATVSGMPVCTDPDSLLYAPCLSYWVLYATVFDTPFVLVFTVAIGLWIFGLFRWILRKVQDIGESLGLK